MQCRKKLSHNNRCDSFVYTDSTQGYCEYHWHMYQIGVDFHDPSYDYDYEDPILKEFLENYENYNFIDSSITRERLILKEIPRSKNINLEELSNDRQNIHTKPIVETVLIRANELIRFSRNNPSDDVVLYLFSDELLSNRAKENLNSHYYSNTSIYDLPNPTYRMVLQGLWNYIQNQTPIIREEMIERLRQELEDNVGTCAQGNISRLTNVLNGYDNNSVEPKLSLSDIMAKIAKEKNQSIRKEKAIETLKKHRVAKEEFKAWMEAIESY